MNSISMKLGWMAGTSKIVKTAVTVRNHHCLLVGPSGTGKTVASKMIAEELVCDGGVVIALDYSGSLNLLNSNDVQRIKIAESGSPFSLLAPIKRPDGTSEQMDDVVEMVIDTFTNVSPLGIRQRAALRRAVAAVYHSGIKRGEELYEIGQALLNAETKEAEAVYEHFQSLFKVRTGVEEIVLQPGKLTIFDFSGFSVKTQRLLAELILATIWRFCRIRGQQSESGELFILCDEFQELNLRENGILSQILREGRKFHLSLILATQTLQSFSKQKLAVIQQAATQLFFRPTSGEIESVVKWILGEKSPELKKKLMTLAIGECIATGVFDVGGCNVDHAIKISFR